MYHLHHSMYPRFLHLLFQSLPKFCLKSSKLGDPPNFWIYLHYLYIILSCLFLQLSYLLLESCSLFFLLNQWLAIWTDRTFYILLRYLKFHLPPIKLQFNFKSFKEIQEAHFILSSLYSVFIKLTWKCQSIIQNEDIEFISVC